MRTIGCLLLLVLSLAGLECSLKQPLDVWHFYKSNQRPNASIEVKGDLLYHLFKKDVNINSVRCKGFFDFFEVDYTCNSPDLKDLDDFIPTFTIECEDKNYKNDRCHVEVYLETRDFVQESKLFQQISNSIDSSNSSRVKTILIMTAAFVVGWIISLVLIAPCAVVYVKWIQKKDS